MKELSIVICNYNKKEYVLNCIDSVLNSSYRDLDIYVVDNASEDGSVEAIEDKFKDKVMLISNTENLGGSGGFNTGIREVLKKDYKYVMLLDNDVILDKEAINNSYRYLEKNDDTAVVGSKIYSMDNKDKIQEMGAEIDFQNFYINPFYKGYIDFIELPEVVECDYVPACSMMVRIEALRRVGIMDEDNFIYWDDIEWGYRFKKAGYKVVTYGKSKVWHKMGVAQRTNTFGTYYFWRNRIHFFAKYIEENRIEDFCLRIFDEIFQAIYSCNYIGKYSSARTIIAAVEDALNDVRGKASQDKILEIEKVKDRFGELIENKNKIALTGDSNIEVLRNIVNKIKATNSETEINLISDNVKNIKQQFEEYEVLSLKSESLKKYETVIKICNHIFDMRNELSNNLIYVDRFFNVIVSEGDRKYIENYDNTYSLMKNIWYPNLLSKMRVLNRKLNK
ncbi:glycosyl transferase [Clostridium acetobutylicum]|nr:glycosyl transferase [Clostridium acetobutylicum]